MSNASTYQKSKKLDSMYHPRLYGDFYEMGLKYGSLLNKHGFELPKISKEKTKFGLESYNELKKFYPEVVEEIKGFAKGIKIKDGILASFLLSIGIFEKFEETAQCSCFAYNNDGSVIFGRNHDYLLEFKKFTESSLIAPKDKYSYISQSDVFIGRQDGINEKGLAIGMNFVNGTSFQPGINFYFITRYILENCSSTKEAIEVIEKTKVSSSINFLLADKSGELAVVESCPKHKEIRHPKVEDNFIVSTNEFISSEMRLYDQGDVNWSKSQERYNALYNYFTAANQLNLQNAKEILSDEENCISMNLKKEKFGTLWSVVANLSELKIERAEGQPKITNYKPDTRLDWWLKRREKVM